MWFTPQKYALKQKNDMLGTVYCLPFPVYQRSQFNCEHEGKGIFIGNNEHETVAMAIEHCVVCGDQCWRNVSAGTARSIQHECRATANHDHANDNA